MIGLELFGVCKEVTPLYLALEIEEYSQEKCVLSYVFPSSAADFTGKLEVGNILFLVDEITNVAVTLLNIPNLERGAVSINIYLDKLGEMTVNTVYFIEFRFSKKNAKDFFISFEIRDKYGKITGKGVHSKKKVKF